MNMETQTATPLGVTAEEMLTDYRARMMKRVKIAERCMEPIFHQVAPDQQVLMREALDEAREYRRVIAALDATLRRLKKPGKPNRDSWRY